MEVICIVCRQEAEDLFRGSFCSKEYLYEFQHDVGEKNYQNILNQQQRLRLKGDYRMKKCRQCGKIEEMHKFDLYCSNHCRRNFHQQTRYQTGMDYREVTPDPRKNGNPRCSDESMKRPFYRKLGIG